MKLPNGPQTPPFLQLIQWIARPLDLMETCAQRYGDFFTLRLGGYSPIVFISSPQAIQEIFTANPEQFDVRKAFLAITMVGRRCATLVGAWQDVLPYFLCSESNSRGGDGCMAIAVCSMSRICAIAIP